MRKGDTAPKFVIQFLPKGIMNIHNKFTLS